MPKQQRPVKVGIDILAAAIRSTARRDFAYTKDELTDEVINKIAEGLKPTSFAYQFYLETTDKQWKKVVKSVKEHYFL